MTIHSKVKQILSRYHTTNADELAKELGIIVLPRAFNRQKGVYKIIERNRFIFIKEDLHPVMHNIVLLHEIGHDVLHRKEAKVAGGFKEFNLFDMVNNRMEYEANMFAAQISLPDDEIIDYITQGYDVAQIAALMNSDINLVALKVADLNSRGANFIEPTHRNDFLK